MWSKCMRHADSRVDIIESLLGAILSKEAGSESQFHRPATACVLGVGTGALKIEVSRLRNAVSNVRAAAVVTAAKVG